MRLFTMCNTTWAKRSEVAWLRIEQRYKSVRDGSFWLLLIARAVMLKARASKGDYQSMFHVSM